MQGTYQGMQGGALSSEAVHVVCPRRKAGEEVKTGKRKKSQPVELSLAMLKPYFKKPLNTVVEELGISATAIKKACRKFGIPKWPSRTLTAKHSKNKADPLMNQLSEDPEEQPVTLGTPMAQPYFPSSFNNPYWGMSHQFSHHASAGSNFAAQPTHFAFHPQHPAAQALQSQPEIHRPMPVPSMAVSQFSHGNGSAFDQPAHHMEHKHQMEARSGYDMGMNMPAQHAPQQHAPLQHAPQYNMPAMSAWTHQPSQQPSQPFEPASPVPFQPGPDLYKSSGNGQLSGNGQQTPAGRQQESHQVNQPLGFRQAHPLAHTSTTMSEARPFPRSLAVATTGSQGLTTSTSSFLRQPSFEQLSCDDGRQAAASPLSETDCASDGSWSSSESPELRHWGGDSDIGVEDVEKLFASTPRAGKSKDDAWVHSQGDMCMGSIQKYMDSCDPEMEQYESILSF